MGHLEKLAEKYPKTPLTTFQKKGLVAVKGRRVVVTKRGMIESNAKEQRRRKSSIFDRL